MPYLVLVKTARAFFGLRSDLLNVDITLHSSEFVVQVTSFFFG